MPVVCYKNIVVLTVATYKVVDKRSKFSSLMFQMIKFYKSKNESSDLNIMRAPDA